MSMIPDLTGGEETESAAAVAVEAREPVPAARKVIQGRSPWQLAWERLRKDRAAWIGHGPNQQFIDIGENANGGPVPPSRIFWLGTDSSGRDLFVRIVYGARVSLSVGVLATMISIALGVAFGLAAGYLGGVVDAVIARLID